MKLGDRAFADLVGVLEKSLQEFRAHTDSPVVTDIRIQAVRESGELIVSDDDKVLDTLIIPDFAEYTEQEFQKSISRELQRALKHIDSVTPLESLGIWKPFSFILVDDEGETLEELMLFDDESSLVSQSLMDGLDEELDEFLRTLLD
ncbi:MAG: hypothetical protein MJY79_03355 [Bacteroidaceae bacterium]|nr:hypothetical protein [Bacteroidaceae bacterium]